MKKQKKTTWIFCLWALLFLNFSDIIFFKSKAFSYNQNQYLEKKIHKKTRKKDHVKFSSSKRAYLKQVYVNATPVFLTSIDIPIPYSKNYTQNINSIQSFTDPRETFDNRNVALHTPFGQISWPEIASRIFVQNNKTFAYYHGFKLELTLDPKIQEAAEQDLDQRKIVFGSTVILDPRTGRILTLAQSGGSRNAFLSVSPKAPVASLIKIVTASAVIEKINLNPDDDIYFRGGCGALRNDNWIADTKLDRQKITFAKTFASSCNTAFARLAIYSSGLASLKIYGDKFMFNKPIPSDVNIQTSLFLLPDPETAIPQEVAEAGAGFGASKLSPIHSALLSATVENNGIMMAPFLVEAAFDNQGKEVYRATPTQIGRVISKSTAVKMAVLMQATTKIGTSRRFFHRRGTLADIDEIGGKTGTLLDHENRSLLYTWFSGVAPMNSPKSVAIGTVIASSQNWVVRASSVAQSTLAQYLKLEKKSARVAIQNN